MAKEMFIPPEWVEQAQSRGGAIEEHHGGRLPGFTISADVEPLNQIDLQRLNQAIINIVNPPKPVCILVPIEDYQALIDRVRELEQMIAEMAE